MASNDNPDEFLSNYESDSSLEDDFPDVNTPGYVGYGFKPQVGSNDELSLSDRSEVDSDDERDIGEMPQVGLRRMNSLDWCSCGHCVIMRTEIENTCGRESNNVLAKEEDDGVVEQCICDIPKCRTFCLDKDVLSVAAITVSTMLRTNLPDPLTDKFFRLTAYRQFTLWIHGKLGRHNSRTIPSCVVQRIRDSYPRLDEDEDFTGFLLP